MDLARPQLEVDVVVGEDAREALDDPARLDGRHGVAVGRRGRCGPAADRRVRDGHAAPRRPPSGPGRIRLRCSAAARRDALVPPVHADRALGAGGAGRELVEVGLLELPPSGRSSLPVLSMIGPANTSNRSKSPASILASVSLTMLEVRRRQLGDTRLGRLAVHEARYRPIASESASKYS